MSQLLVALALSVAAPGLKDKPAPEPTLIGEWVPESVTAGGRGIRPGLDKWVFGLDGTFAIWANGKVVQSGPFTRDPKAAPGTLDLGQAGGRGPADLCRFQIDGETLTLSVGHDQGERPADLRPGPKVTVWIFKRAGKKD
jgi:uncharacterized protein (TIGR03067 family)